MPGGRTMTAHGPAGVVARRITLLAVLGLLTAQAPVADNGRTAPVNTPEPTAMVEKAVVPVRTGTHPGFGRIVLDAPPKARYRLTREGDQVTIRLVDDLTLGAPGVPPRNVSRLGVSGARAEFTVAAGATLREARLGQRIVIDVVDPTTPATPQEPRPTRTPTAKEARTRAEPPPTRPATVVPIVASVPQGPVPVASRPVTPEPVKTLPSPSAAVPKAVPPPSPPTQVATEPPAPAPAPRIAVQADPPPEPLTSPGANPPAVVAAPPPAPAASPTPAPPQPTPRGPMALIARRLPSAPASDVSAMVVPFSDSVGAALFHRESAVLAVFGERRPVDMTLLRDDPVFASATVHLLPNATLLRLPIPDGRSVSMATTPQGWRIAILPVSAPRPAITPIFADGRVMFPVAAPAEVVTISDPDSGATLLVGTVARALEAITTERRTVEFTLHATLRGVVVEPLSDSVSLRVVPKGFVLTGPPDGLALSPPSAMTNTMLAAARLTRRFRFPAMPIEGLAQRVLAHVREAASMPPLARGPARKVAAETMVALGMAAEADALLRVISEQDPKEVASPDTVILRAIAALLAGRPNDARPLADPRFAGTDEDALWRAALLATRQEGSPEAAQLFASTAPLILLYPPTLRDRLLPLALETMVLGGGRAAAEEILAERPDDPLLRIASALVRQARGDTDGALVLFDEVAQGRDQLARARAAVRAVEVRLASGRLEPAAAADALDRLLYAWRGDWRDLSLRRRIAELRQHSGAWRTALSILRDALPDFPAYANQIQSWQQSAFAELVHGDDVDKLDPMELIGLVEENADLLPATEQGDRLRDRLADRLLALELPKRADTVLTKLMQTAPTEMGRAGYGTRLARLRLNEGDAEGALAALGQSSNPALPQTTKDERLLTSAAALGRLGNTKGALNALAGLDSAAADETRAAVQEQAKDWRGAGQALASLARRTLPETGELDDPQRRILLRLATAAARAGDNATLARLREKEAERMGGGPLGDMFRLLTAESVRGADDLPRAQQEIGLARALPAGLKALDGPPRPP